MPTSSVKAVRPRAIANRSRSISNVSLANGILASAEKEHTRALATLIEGTLAPRLKALDLNRLKTTHPAHPTGLISVSRRGRLAHYLNPRPWGIELVHLPPYTWGSPISTVVAPADSVGSAITVASGSADRLTGNIDLWANCSDPGYPDAHFRGPGQEHFGTADYNLGQAAILENFVLDPTIAGSNIGIVQALCQIPGGLTSDLFSRVGDMASIFGLVSITASAGGVSATATKRFVNGWLDPTDTWQSVILSCGSATDWDSQVSEGWFDSNFAVTVDVRFPAGVSSMAVEVLASVYAITLSPNPDPYDPAFPNARAYVGFRSSFNPVNVAAISCAIPTA
jgi:hypothetical protein